MCQNLLGSSVATLRQQMCVRLNVVMEHRFAFCAWIKLKQELLAEKRLRDVASFRPPDLVSFDWHDDTGSPDDYDERQLKKLNQRKENEVTLFAWAGLPALNDGHIPPAVWLNAVGNVYIVNKQNWHYNFSRDETIVDRFGNEHQLVFRRTPKQFAKVFRETHTGEV